MAGYNQVFNLPYTIIRPSALYGERCVSRRVGQAFIENALVGEDLTINGDGEQRRDFTYVGDVISANIKASMSDKVGKGEILNVGNGDNRSVNDIAKMIGGPIEYRDPVIEPRETLADNNKAKQILGWKPKTKIEDWMKTYKERMEL